MIILELKNILFKILLTHLIGNFYASASSPALLAIRKDEDAVKEWTSEFVYSWQENYNKNMEIIDFLSSINASLDKISEKVNILKVKIPAIQGFIELNNLETTSCGGLVKVLPSLTSTIRYTKGEGYSNNERCVWALSPKIPFDFYRIKVNALYMEPNYDGVTIYFRTSTVELQSQKITKFGEWISFPGPFAIITFCSDLTEAGSGFEAAIAGEGTSPEPKSYKSHWLKYPNGNFQYFQDSNEDKILTVVAQPEKDSDLEVTFSSINFADDDISFYRLTCQHNEIQDFRLIPGPPENGSWIGASAERSSSNYPFLVIAKPKPDSQIILNF